MLGQNSKCTYARIWSRRPPYPIARTRSRLPETYGVGWPRSAWRSQGVLVVGPVATSEDRGRTSSMNHKPNNTPGFTAPLSLIGRRRRYRAVVCNNRALGALNVVPQTFDVICVQDGGDTCKIWCGVEDPDA